MKRHRVPAEYRVIMVCLGNICRSPAAEVVLRRKLELAHLDHVVVDSAGTGGWHVGDAADPRSQAAWELRGYTGDHRARQFRREWFDERDLVLVMDAQNHATLQALARTEAQRSRIRYLREFDPAQSSAGTSDPGQLEVPDPYYGGAQGFEHMLDLIERACDGLIEALRNKSL